MQLLTARQTEIMAMARQRGRVLVDNLAEHFLVTPQTIRKDLNELCGRRLLSRLHGGAAHPSGVTNYAYEARRLLAADGKRRIGQRAAELIPDHSSLMLNIGTTTEQVATALIGHSGLMVVTNNVNVANILREVESAEVMIAGGLVRRTDGGVVGETAVDFMRQFRVDYAVIGVSAIDSDGSLLDFDLREVKVAQAIIAAARTTILVADATKFTRHAPVRIGHLEQIDVLVTDEAPSSDFRSICETSGVRIEVAGEPDGRNEPVPA
jgi:DeoR family glycerol-3-phosphate regulon repressor